MSDNVTVMLIGTPDEQKKVIKELTEARLAEAGRRPIPEQPSHIVPRCAGSRFNKIGSEGLESHTVEGELMSDDDFAPYAVRYRTIPQRNERVE